MTKTSNKSKPFLFVFVVVIFVVECFVIVCLFVARLFDVLSHAFKCLCV